MYSTDEQATGSPATLADRLESDPKGALRDSMLQTLHAAEDEIHATLGGPLGAEDKATLKSLLEAIALGERELLSAWDALHRDPAPRPGAQRK